MKVIVTQKQLEQIRENTSKKFSCDKCDHSWEIEKKDKHPYLCHMCGYDSAKEKHNYDELENFWKEYKKEEEVTEKWSEKYKKSINCSNPKGFSQRAHCQGRKKRLKEDFENEEKFKEAIKKSVNMYASSYEWCDGVEISIRETNWLTDKQKPVYEYGVKFKDYSSVDYKEQENLFDDIMFVHTMYFPIEDDDIDCYMSVKSIYPNGVERGFPYSYDNYNETITESKDDDDDLKKYGYDIKGIKTAIKIMSQLSETYGEGISLDFTLHDYYLKQNDLGYKPVLQLFIDIDKKDGNEYKITQMYRHEISVELLKILEMFGLYNDEKMSPYYNFHFNERSLK